jgi:pimeloyl-ACP methyl ester carboxylesterase
MNIRIYTGVAAGLTYLILLGFLSASAPAQAASLPVETRTVESRDGVRIAYDVRGTEQTTLVFVHCWACNRFFWRKQADEFSSNYRVVTVDLGGHGESGKNRETWSVLGLAGDVVAVADALHLRRMILIGHSMGGSVALEATRLLRGRVLGVVLVDSVDTVDDRKSVASAEADALRLRRDFKGYFRDLSSLFSRTSDPEIRHWVEEQAMAAAPGPITALKLDMPNLDLRILFAKAAVPLRAINAAPPLSDRTDIEENKRYADYEATLVSDAGHFLMLERPAEFNQALKKWVTALSE